MTIEKLTNQIMPSNVNTVASFVFRVVSWEKKIEEIYNELFTENWRILISTLINTTLSHQKTAST